MKWGMGSSRDRRQKQGQKDKMGNYSQSVVSEECSGMKR
jgi:hypothetical protein